MTENRSEYVKIFNVFLENNEDFYIKEQQ